MVSRISRSFDYFFNPFTLSYRTVLFCLTEIFILIYGKNVSSQSLFTISFEVISFLSIAIFLKYLCIAMMLEHG